MKERVSLRGVVAAILAVVALGVAAGGAATASAGPTQPAHVCPPLC
jgi:hypothetical protein